MCEIHETHINHENGEDFISVCSDEMKWRNKVYKLKEKFPDDVEIIHEADDNHGMVYAKIPYKFLKLSPPRVVSYTEEQRRAMLERIQKVNEERKRAESREGD